MDIGIRRIPGIGGESEDDGRFTFPPEALDTMRHAAAMITMDRQRIVTDTSEADGARQARQFGFPGRHVRLLFNASNEPKGIRHRIFRPAPSFH